MRVILFSVLALLIFPVGKSFASAYYWTVSGVIGKFGSAQEACMAAKRDSAYQFKRVEVNYNGNPRQAQCYWTHPAFPPDQVSAIYGPYRYGDSCPTGAQYNGATGGCDCPDGQTKDEGGNCQAPPTCEAGLPLLLRSPDGPAITSGGRVYIISSPPSNACSGGCQYQPTTSRATTCYLVKGSSTTGFCNYTMSSDGQSCAADNAIPPAVGDPPNPPSPDGETDPAAPPTDPNDPGCPKGYSWSGTTCVKSPTDPEGGGEGGGTDPGTDPGAGGGNGGGDGGGTDPGTGGGNGGGTAPGTGGGDGTGTGGGNGNGNGNGNGDGEGDGEGECDPTKNPLCAGIPGPSGSLGAPEAGSWDEANAEWDERVTEAKKELKDAVKANIDHLKGAFDLQLSTGGGQLPCDSFTVWGKSYRLCVADYSTQLSYMRLALLLMAALIAAFVILKE